MRKFKFRVVMVMYVDATAQVRMRMVSMEFNNKFSGNTGMHQGSVLSPL